MKRKIGTAMVVGAGISGIRSALDLAEVGYGVTLIDSSPYLGGILTQLDYQFPTDHCGMCKMLPTVERDASSQYCLRKGLFHENIDILLSTELISVEGSPGNFQVTLKSNPSWVDAELCIGCGDCVDKCPEEIPDSFNLGLGKRKAIYLPVPHNIPNTYLIDPDACTKCGDCVDVCPTHAVKLPDKAMDAVEREVEVGTIVLSAGTKYYDPSSGRDTYGYNEFPDVITSREFERLISGSGPNNGKLLKPSDGKPAKKIAWFQCIGSRDSQTDSEFCSSVCCMHAVKEARLVKEMSGGDVETAIFYMDMRTFGKSFQRYRDEAENKYGVRFERSRVHSVVKDFDGNGLTIVHVNHDGTRNVENFDIVVLSIGQRPADGIKELSEKLELPLNQWGFCQSEPFAPSLTRVEGIVLGGSYSGLKDISESVIHAGSASLTASRVLHSSGGSLAVEKEQSNEYKDVSKESPRILAVICHCGNSLKESLDKDALKRDLETDPYVEKAIFIDQTCTAEGWETLVETSKENNPNRILIGACLPHVYDRSLKRLGQEIKLDPTFIEVVDIRSSGFSTPFNAMKIGISKLKQAETTPVMTQPINQRALVIGGGISGMTAALAIADHGYDVDLIEQEREFGGNLKWLNETLDGFKTEDLLTERLAKLKDHPQVHLHNETTVLNSNGQVGAFQTIVKHQDDSVETLTHGVTILATGGQEAATAAYQYEKSDLIVTQKELDQKLANGSIDPSNLNSVVMIQCVDSREDPRNYCSRICCTSSLKNALHLKMQHPDVAVYVFYRDLMAYGFAETYYTKAREAGVIFIPFKTDAKPQVTVTDNGVTIAAFEPIIGRDLEIEANLLVVAPGIVPSASKEFFNLMGTECDQDGFFLEADSKWRPVDSIKEGIFACGLAHSPRDITESIASAEAAAQRALRLLNNKRLVAGKVVAEVRHAICSLCERCLDECPYGARQIIDEKVDVNSLMCQGCGSCAAVCPNSASIVKGYRDQQMMDEIESAMAGIL